MFEKIGSFLNLQKERMLVLDEKEGILDRERRGFGFPGSRKTLYAREKGTNPNNQDYHRNRFKRCASGCLRRKITGIFTHPGAHNTISATGSGVN